MGLGGDWDTRPYRPQDIDAAESAIAAALDAGIHLGVPPRAWRASRLSY
jgi:hypothetical protein